MPSPMPTHKPEEKSKNAFLRALDSFKAFFSNIWELFMTFIGRRKGTETSSTTPAVAPELPAVKPPATISAPASTAPVASSSLANDPHATERAKLDSEIASLEQKFISVVAEYERTQEHPGPDGKDHQVAADARTAAEKELFELRAKRYTLGDTSGQPRETLLKIKMAHLVNELESSLKGVSSNGRLDGIEPGHPLLSIKSSLGMIKGRMNIPGEEVAVSSCVELEGLIKKVHDHQNSNTATSRPS